jgi:hypothetical protein
MENELGNLLPKIRARTSDARTDDAILRSAIFSSPEFFKIYHGNSENNE